jgi:hypothetical protein
MLRREQGRKEASVLLKEKDEIIKQVMAEGDVFIIGIICM